MIKTSDYALAEKRGPQGWDYLIALAQPHRSHVSRLSYVAYCVERAIYG